MKTKRAKAKRELRKAVIEFCTNAPIGFSTCGGTVRILAGYGAEYFSMPYKSAVRTINKIVEGLPGFYSGAVFEMEGDVSGFGRFLARNYK
jgi:hypothetical protein